MIMEISAQLRYYAWLVSMHWEEFGIPSILLSPLPHYKDCSEEQILSSILMNFFYETSQENFFFNHDKFGIHWSSNEA